MKRKNLGRVERERERELYLNKISFIKHVKKYKKIYKDRLYAKVDKKLMQNRLSFLRALEMIETKDKYA